MLSMKNEVMCSDTFYAQMNINLLFCAWLAKFLLEKVFSFFQISVYILI